MLDRVIEMVLIKELLSTFKEEVRNALSVSLFKANSHFVAVAGTSLGLNGNGGQRRQESQYYLRRLQ
jgi:hypothetical protein